MVDELFIDSAIPEEIVSALSTGAVTGVTTNPSLVSKATAISYYDAISQVFSATQMASPGRAHLSIEAFGDDLISTSETYASRLKSVAAATKHVDLHIKVPVSYENLSKIERLSRMGYHVNATACFTATQAFLAAKAGADVVSFFYCRMKDASLDIAEMISWFKEMMNSGPDRRIVRVICGSIRTPQDAIEAWNAGANIVTAPLSVIKGLMSHPKTDEAIRQFEEAGAMWKDKG